jgi:hypothetical protein
MGFFRGEILRCASEIICFARRSTVDWRAPGNDCNRELYLVVILALHLGLYRKRGIERVAGSESVF